MSVGLGYVTITLFQATPSVKITLPAVYVAAVIPISVPPLSGSPSNALKPDIAVVGVIAVIPLGNVIGTVTVVPDLDALKKLGGSTAPDTHQAINERPPSGGLFSFIVLRAGAEY